MNRSRLSQNKANTYIPPMAQSDEMSPPLQRLSRKKPANFHLILWPVLVNLLSAIVGGIFLCLAHGDVDNVLAGMIIAGVGSLIGLIGMIYFYMLLYHAWWAIQGSTARTTPGKAVGFMFIPFFNIYWQFQALAGWAKDYNQHLAQSGLDRPDKRANEGLFLTQCILVCCLVVPFVNILVILALLPISLVNISQTCRCVNYLATGE